MLLCGMNFTAAVAVSNAGFGLGSGPIFLDDVFCTGFEQELLQCFHNRIGDHNCFHFEDAGVICSGNTIDIGYK